MPPTPPRMARGSHMPGFGLASYIGARLERHARGQRMRIGGIHTPIDVVRLDDDLSSWVRSAPAGAVGRGDHRIPPVDSRELARVAHAVDDSRVAAAGHDDQASVPHMDHERLVVLDQRVRLPLPVAKGLMNGEARSKSVVRSISPVTSRHPSSSDDGQDLDAVDGNRWSPCGHRIPPEATSADVASAPPVRGDGSPPGSS